MKLKILGCYAPSWKYKKNKVSCYKLINNDKNIILDMGYYMYKSFTVQDLEKSKVFISHNHVDHSYGLFQLMYKLDKTNTKLNNKIDIYMPEKSKFKNLFKALEVKKNTNVHAINKDLEVQIDNLVFTFCETIHKGESYAIKILNKENNKTFVYTSDIATIDEKLINFCKGADEIMMEAGHSVNFQPFTLGKYHGYTKDLSKEILKTGVDKIYITHYKSYANEEKIRKFLPKEMQNKFYIVKQGEEIDIL